MNLKFLEKLAIALEELNDEVVFVGGAVISMYVTDEDTTLGPTNRWLKPGFKNAYYMTVQET